MDSRNHSRAEGYRQIQQFGEQEEMRRLQAEEASTSMMNSSQSHPLRNIASAIDSMKFTFICECFFLTARVLNLGLIKALSDFKSLLQVSTSYKNRCFLHDDVDKGFRVWYHFNCNFAIHNAMDKDAY